jgi:hypothetical protein
MVSEADAVLQTAGNLKRASFKAGRHKADIDNQLRHGVPRLT